MRKCTRLAKIKFSPQEITKNISIFLKIMPFTCYYIIIKYGTAKNSRYKTKTKYKLQILGSRFEPCTVPPLCWRNSLMNIHWYLYWEGNREWWCLSQNTNLYFCTNTLREIGGCIGQIDLSYTRNANPQTLIVWGFLGLDLIKNFKEKNKWK